MTDRRGRRRFLKTGMATVAAALAAAREAYGADLQTTFERWNPGAGSGGAFSPGTGRGSRGGPVPVQDFDDLRRAYGLDDGVVYFNHASIGTTPTIVREALERYQRACETNPWLYVWSDGFGDARERVRGKAARLLGCDPDELALTHNTTEGFNTLAQGLPLGPGDEVLFSSMNHPGASICWRHQARRRGFTVRQFDFPVARAAAIDGDDLVDQYVGRISDRTRVLVFPHVDNIVGFRYPVARLAAAARERGVEYVAVDGAQAVGMLSFALADLGVDFYATSPHKWIQAPKEHGLLWVRRERIGELEPMWTTWGQDRWRGSARIYEDYGTRDLPGLMAFGDALDFQARLGAEAKAARYRELRDLFRRGVDEHPRLRWRSPDEGAAEVSLYAVELEGVRSDELFDRLFAEHGFVFRAFRSQGLDTARISPNVFASPEQIERFLDVTR